MQNGDTVATKYDASGLLSQETFADGWWYTAALPDGRRVIACMTDADAVRPLGLRSGAGFARLLARTRHVGAVGDGIPSDLRGPLMAVSDETMSIPSYAYTYAVC